MVTAASERIYSEIKDSTTEEFSDDVTTRVSFETSYDVLSNDPEIVQNAVTSDDINDNKRTDCDNIAWHKVTDYAEYTSLVSDILCASADINLFPSLKHCVSIKTHLSVDK